MGDGGVDVESFLGGVSFELRREMRHLPPLRRVEMWYSLIWREWFHSRMKTANELSAPDVRLSKQPFLTAISVGVAVPTTLICTCNSGWYFGFRLPIQHFTLIEDF